MNDEAAMEQAYSLTDSLWNMRSRALGRAPSEVASLAAPGTRGRAMGAPTGRRERAPRVHSGATAGRRAARACGAHVNRDAMLESGPMGAPPSSVRPVPELAVVFDFEPARERAHDAEDDHGEDHADRGCSIAP